MTTGDAYSELLNRLHHAPSERVERILRKLVDPEDASLMLELPAASAAELAQRLSIREEGLALRLQQLWEKGVVVKGKKGFRMPAEISHLHDSTLSSAEKWVDLELLDLWKDYYEAESFPGMEVAYKTPGAGSAKVVRVLPAVKAIERSPGLSEEMLGPEENIRELMRTAEARCVVPCTCRRKLRRCDGPLWACLLFNRTAEHAIARGAGRRLSAEEAIAVADESEKAGLVHTRMLVLGPELREVCNCCRDCCTFFDPAVAFSGVNRLTEKSRFRAAVSLEKCNGCQDCVERCVPYAVEMRTVPGSRKLKAFVDEEKCIGCGVCVVGCEAGALILREAGST